MWKKTHTLWGLSQLPNSSWVSFASVGFWRIASFHLSCQINVCAVVCSSPFYVSVDGSDMLFPNIGELCLLLFFLSARDLSTHWCFQRTSFWFHWFFSVLNFSDTCSYLYHFLPSACFGFICWGFLVLLLFVLVGFMPNMGLELMSYEFPSPVERLKVDTWLMNLGPVFFCNVTI